MEVHETGISVESVVAAATRAGSSNGKNATRTSTFMDVRANLSVAAMRCDILDLRLVLLVPGELMYPDDLGYTREHEWVRDEGDHLLVGITAYAQEELGDVVYVELPTPGESFAAGDEFGTVESVKAVSPLYVPMSGEILEVNEELEAQPELINEDPYAAGWMIRLAASDPSERDTLLDAQAYEQLVNELRA